MQTPRLHVSCLPLFTNARARCARCGARYRIWVIFCRGCLQVAGGEHFHRRCERCDNRWIEQATERGRDTEAHREAKPQMNTDTHRWR
jgi:predicted amidophosphoribosyltransferase